MSLTEQSTVPSPRRDRPPAVSRALRRCGVRRDAVEHSKSRHRVDAAHLISERGGKVRNGTPVSKILREQADQVGDFAAFGAASRWFESILPSQLRGPSKLARRHSSCSQSGGGNSWLEEKKVTETETKTKNDALGNPKEFKTTPRKRRSTRRVTSKRQRRNSKRSGSGPLGHRLARPAAWDSLIQLRAHRAAIAL